ncbi:hypothetical protein PM082_011048 [Marasmius tenuissimus]|nr:hypothetical protein PM082_011048 [Marasmius tenuissimus]
MAFGNRPSKEEDGMRIRMLQYQSQRRDLLSSVFLDADPGDVFIPISVLSTMSKLGTTQIPPPSFSPCSRPCHSR